MTVPDYLKHIHTDTEDLPVKPFYECDYCRTPVYSLFETEKGLEHLCYRCHQQELYEGYRYAWEGFDFYAFMD